jgi:hypothetical protein
MEDGTYLRRICYICHIFIHRPSCTLATPTRKTLVLQNHNEAHYVEMLPFLSLDKAIGVLFTSRHHHQEYARHTPHQQ